MTAVAPKAGLAHPPSASAPTAAVSIEHVSKRFRMSQHQFKTIKQRALHPFAARDVEDLVALHDVNLEVARGEFVGIVGRNGSGKSTLLKCLAGIYAADGGRIRIEGRLSPFIELGVGFHQELTARDNVLINAVMLGLTKREARRRFDEILAFAELEEFVDMKLKNYSSGMAVRLGFAVAVQVDADVLLVDEVLAVGDASFQRKCFERFEQLKEEGRTIIFVTHDMNAVERFSDRAMLLERGHVQEIGEPDRIARRYQEINFGQLGSGTPGADVSVADCWCEDGDGQRVDELRQGAGCVACVDLEVHAQVEAPRFAIAFRNEIRHTVFVARSSKDDPVGTIRPGDRVRMRAAFDLWLAPSVYTLSPTVLDRDEPIAVHPDAATLSVIADRRSGGVVDLPTAVEVQRL